MPSVIPLRLGFHKDNGGVIEEKKIPFSSFRFQEVRSVFLVKGKGNEPVPFLIRMDTKIS